MHLTGSDADALPANYTFKSTDKGIHTFSVTLTTAGGDTITATDASNGTLVGSLTETVTPAAASKLVFGQQPTGAVAGALISPAVTVTLVDAYGNLLANDNSAPVTIALGADPGGALLSGTTTVTVNGGVATFSGLSISAAGSFTLTANFGKLTAVSSNFTITAVAAGGGGGGSITNGTVIEGFENSEMWNIADGFAPTAVLATYAAHDGNYGLDQYNGNDWIYRTDTGAQLHAGDTVSVWLQFSDSADGRAYFGFGASAAGALSLVAAPNTNQLILQSNVGFGYTNLAAVNQKFVANQWYRLEVDWSTSGAIVGKLFASDGATLLNQVSASTTAIKSGGIAFRATGSDKFWDTVTASYGVNTFARPAASHAGLTTSFGSATPPNYTPPWVYWTPPQAHTNRYDPWGEWF